MLSYPLRYFCDYMCVYTSKVVWACAVALMQYFPEASYSKPLSPSSIICYQPSGVISLAGKVTVSLEEIKVTAAYHQVYD